MVVNHNFPSENEVEADDNETLRELGGAMSTHHKVSTWYAEVTASDDFYRSNVVFLEVSLLYRGIDRFVRTCMLCLLQRGTPRRILCQPDLCARVTFSSESLQFIFSHSLILSNSPSCLPSSHRRSHSVSVFFTQPNVLAQVKMRELLGDAWPQASSGPDVVRASVCCDMLG